ncbi:hypothetical protein BYT27DRAFT_7159803 [Phlegmacium glaucopus]|nr:hypothetical protein BYT27DRAFT_7159803 [Phlegmacium glaucopus]
MFSRSCLCNEYLLLLTPLPFPLNQRSKNPYPQTTLFMSRIVQPLFPRQSSNCILTCPDPLPCSCAANEDCVRINRDCQTCSQNKCVARQNTSVSSTSGISKGALAGSIIGALAFLVIVSLLFLRYRRKSLLRKALANGREVKKDIPASAETVLNRPDPTEKPSVPNAPRLYPTTSVDFDPQAHSSSLPPTAYNSSRPNPFDDTNSIQTAGTEGTNVIPIGLVSTQSHRASTQNSESDTLPSTNSSFPMRPARSPELNLNLDHVNVSHDNLRVTNKSKSIRSGISGISSRNSYMSNASYSSDLLSEAPMIMTPTKSSIRQVVGVVKAEVINSDSLGSGDNLKPPAYAAKATPKSPLAATSFGPDDIVDEGDESQDAANPFGDESISNRATTASTQPYHPDGFDFSSSKPNADSRPSSMATQAGSIINISSATRVAVGSKSTGAGIPRRTTVGRLVTPPANATTLQEQQQRALAHAHAQAKAQGLDTRRISGSSVLSATSTRADSILESFPFVPPSPISDRPIRSPPVSPLAQQSFVNSSSSSPLHQHTFVVAPPSPLSHQSFGAESGTTAPPTEDALNLPAPPDRRTLGLSTGSQLSTASSGLGSFPFQIESETASEIGSRPSAFNSRQRASLDTLALTTALTSYPLGFDRGNAYPPPKK